MLRALLEAVVLLLVVRAVWKLLGGMLTVRAGATRRPAAGGETRAVKLVRDPVCGTYVQPSSAISDGKEYFCSEKCRGEFQQAHRARPRAT